MFNLIDRWLKKNPNDERLITAPRAGLSRRGFLRGLTAGLIGVSTGIVVPSQKIVVPGNCLAMLDYPREFSILGFTISFDSMIGLKLQQPLYDTEKIDFARIAKEPMYFQKYEAQPFAKPAILITSSELPGFDDRRTV